MQPIPKPIYYYGIFLVVVWTIAGAIPFFSPETVIDTLSLQYYGSVMGLVYMWGTRNIVMSVIMAASLNSKYPRLLAWMFVMRFLNELLDFFIWLSEGTYSLNDMLVTIQVRSSNTSSTLGTSTVDGLLLVLPIVLFIFLIPEYICAKKLFHMLEPRNINPPQEGPYYVPVESSNNPRVIQQPTNNFAPQNNFPPLQQRRPNNGPRSLTIPRQELNRPIR